MLDSTPPGIGLQCDSSLTDPAAEVRDHSCVGTKVEHKWLCVVVKYAVNGVVIFSVGRGSSARRPGFGPRRLLPQIPLWPSRRDMDYKGESQVPRCFR
jgi:hypothetical protein